MLTGTLQELFRRRKDIEFVVFCTVFNRELLDVDAPNVERMVLPLDGFFDELDRLARANEIDVLFRSYPTVEQVQFPLERQIFLLPDLQHEYFPEFFDSLALRARRLAFERALGAGGIMTISEFARGTMEERSDGRDVCVARPSVPPDFVAARSADATKEERDLVPPGDFFLFPANLWPHKNHARLIEALRHLRERTGRLPELVLTGSPSGWETLRPRTQDLPIRHLGYVRAPLLRLLYEKALALTFFSKYEGFGIPLLEAFEAGTPVVCSNTTSLPEVAGDAALMCDPDDAVAMSDLLERIAGDADLRACLVSRGRRRLRKFSWAEAADELGKAINRVGTGKRSPPLERQPLVSIITPSYNQGRFIRETIESVLAQTYANIEYLVIDGGSTDETLEILQAFGSRFRWISEPDSGQAEAINKGLQIATGQIVGYLNSDDILLPDAIEQVVRHFQEHPECDLVYGDAQYIDGAGAVIGTYRTAAYSFELLMEDCCICQPATYWRSDAGAAVGPFDEELQYAMDYDYWIRFDRAGFVIQYMPKPIAQSRLHPEAKTLRARREIYREIFRVCRQRGGYISHSYVYGLWDEIASESPVGRLVRHVPGLHPAVAAVHHRRLNRRPHALARRVSAFRFAVRMRIVRLLERRPRLLTLALVTRARLQSFRLSEARAGGAQTPPPNAHLRVTGFWPDNCVGPRLNVVVDPRDHARTLRLVGRPFKTMTVDVSSNGSRIGQFHLRQGREETIDVELPPGPRAVVAFAFPEHELDEAGRSVAFLLQETNAFSEDDLRRVG